MENIELKQGEETKMNNKKNLLYIIPAVFLIVFLIMAFGSSSGDDVKANELALISFTVSDYEVINDEDNTIESIILSAKEYKTRFSVDAIDLISDDNFAKSLVKNKTKLECFAVQKDIQSDSPEEIAQIFAISADNKSETILQIQAKSGSKNGYILVDKSGKEIAPDESISNEGMDAGSIFALLIPLIIAVASALFIYYKVGKDRPDLVS